MRGLWKHEYLSFVDPGLCFAEDIFGNQFSIKDGSVNYFEVETSALKPVAANDLPSTRPHRALRLSSAPLGAVIITRSQRSDG